MASKMSSDSLKNLCECPVCFEPCKDPRLLKCGHQFCQNCLKNIANHTPHGNIPCPVCREVTKPQHGDVSTLPRSTLHQYMQELIFRQPTEEALGLKCAKCKVNKPTRHCPDCTADLAYFCDNCFAVHQKAERFAKHSTVQFDPLLVCSEHQHKMVENYCYDCNKAVCVECLFNSHGEHTTEYLQNAAEESRKVLKEYILKHEGTIIDRNILPKLKQASSKLQEKQNSITKIVQNVKNAWEKLEEKLDKLVHKTNKAIDIDMKKLLTHQTKITEVAAAQEKMLKLAESLLGDVSDPLVIKGSRDLPKPDIDITEIEANIPVIGEQFDKMAADIETMTKSVDIRYRKEVYKVNRGRLTQEWDLKHVRDIQGGHLIQGLAMDCQNNQIVMRDSDKNGQVKVYNTNGDLIHQMGQQTLTVPANFSMAYYSSMIAIDSHRDLYVLPCNVGSLVRMEMDGRVRDTTKLGSNLCGVAYIPDHDLYVLSDYVPGNSRVFLVSPDTLTVVSSLGDKGTLSNPYNVCVGDINHVTTIVVSDRGTNTLYLYSVSGELMRTYGPETHTLERLYGPWGVSVDRSGCIVVCDYYNNRVLRVWSDKDGDHWECLLDRKQLGDYPLCLDIDNDNRLMAVSVGYTVKLYTF